MITDERKVRIMEILYKDGFVSVRQLMDDFGISRSSIMRDLDELEKEGSLVRQRGGASLKETKELLNQFNEPSVKEKVLANSLEKKKICQRAADLVKDGSCIYIDSGTTSYYLVQYLKDKQINVVTPNIRLASQLTEEFKGHVLLLAGDYSPKYETVSGSITNNMLNAYHFDYAFLTASGVDFETQEVFGFDASLANDKKKVLERSDHAELLIDQTKFELKGLSTWAHIEDFDHVFVDAYKYEDQPENVVVCE